MAIQITSVKTSILFFVIFANVQAQSLEKEISRLSSNDEIACYWEMILSTDQAFRSGTFNFYKPDCKVDPVAEKSKVDSVDCLNLKRTILMLKHHGFPSKNEFFPHVHSTPAIILIHQKHGALREFYYPLFRKHLKDGSCSLNEAASVLQMIYGQLNGTQVHISNENGLDSIAALVGLDDLKASFELDLIDSLCRN